MDDRQELMELEELDALERRASGGGMSAPSGSSGFTPTMQKIEGTGKNPYSSAYGKGQFLDSTWKRVVKKYGSEETAGMTDAQIMALKKDDSPFKDKMIDALAGENNLILGNVLGRAPNEAEAYLAWQQGPAGAAALLKNPNKRAIDAIAPFYKNAALARDAIVNNGGNVNMSAGDFAQKWMSRFKPQPEGLGGQIKERFRQGDDIARRVDAGEINPVHGMFQYGGKVIAGGVNDALGAAAMAVTPDGYTEAMGSVTRPIEQSGFGQAVGGAIEQGMRGYDKFAQQNPNAAADIEAGLNIAGLPLGARAAGWAGEKAAQGGSMLKRAEKAPVQTSEQIKAGSRKLFEQAKAEGGLIPPQDVGGWLDKLKTSDIIPQEAETKTMFGVSPAEELVSKAELLRDKPLTLNAAMEIDKKLGDLIDNHFDPLKGSVDAEGLKYQKIQEAFRDMVDESGTGLKWGEAKFEWAKASAMRDIERILARAQRMQVPATGIKSGFRTLLDNPRRMRAFKRYPEEMAAIKKAADTGVLTGSLNILGNRLGPWAAGIAGGVGGGIGGAVLAAAAGAAVSGVARKGAEALQKRPVNKLMQSISERKYSGSKAMPFPITQAEKSALKKLMQDDSGKVDFSPKGKTLSPEEIKRNEVLDHLSSVVFEKVPKKPQTLTQFIHTGTKDSKTGRGWVGLKPSPELEHLGISNKSRPGFIDSRRGLTLDKAREYAVENGYLKDGADISEFLDMLADESHGRQEYFSTIDHGEANDYLSHMSAKDEAGRLMSETDITLKDVRKYRNGKIAKMKPKDAMKILEEGSKK